MGIINNISNFFVRNRYQKQWFPQLQDAVWNGRRSKRLDKIRQTWGGVIITSFFKDAVGHSKNFYNRKVSPLLFSKKNTSSNSLKKAAAVAGVGLSVLGFIAVKRFFFQAASNPTVLSGGIGISPEFLPNAASAVKGLISSLQANLPSLATSSAGLSNGVVVALGILAITTFLVSRNKSSSRAVESTPRDEKPVVKETESRSEEDEDRPQRIQDIREIQVVDLRKIDRELQENGDKARFLNRAGYSFREFSSPEDRQQPAFFAIMRGLDRVARI